MITKNKTFVCMLGSICVNSMAFCSDSSLTKTNFLENVSDAITVSSNAGLKRIHFKLGGDKCTKETSLKKTETTEISEVALHSTSRSSSSSSKTKTSFGVSASIGGKGGSANVGGGTKTQSTSNESVTDSTTQNEKTTMKTKSTTKDTYKDGVKEFDATFFHHSSGNREEENF